jgi:hypothetical protein
VSSSSISPCGKISCSSETRHSRGKICGSLRWVENSRRREYISTIDSRRDVVVDLVVRRLGTPGVFKSLQVKSVKARSHEGMKTIDLGSLHELSQSLDQAVEGKCKNFDELSLRGS